MKRKSGLIFAGLACGCVTGILGTGGGMVLIPLLQKLLDIEKSKIFSFSVAIMLPVAFFTFLLTLPEEPFRWSETFPFLCGSVVGGWIAGKKASNISPCFLHLIFALFCLWGGLRRFC